MSTMNRVGTLICICLVAACGDTPTGVEPFDPEFGPQFGVVSVEGNTSTYTFDDLSNHSLFCSTAVTGDVDYHDLTFDERWDDGWLCSSDGLTFPELVGRAFSITHATASEVSVDEAGGFSNLTLTAFDASGASCATVVDKGTKLTVVCTDNEGEGIITSIEL